MELRKYCFWPIFATFLHLGNDLKIVGEWRSKKMSSVHAGQNPREVQRVNSEHPVNEARTVLRNQRLLGQFVEKYMLVRAGWENVTP